MPEDGELDNLDTDFEAEPVSKKEAKENDEELRREYPPGAESLQIPTTAEYMARLTPEQLAQVGEQLASPDISDFSDASPEELDKLRSAYEDELSHQVGQLLDESGTGSQAGVQSSPQQGEEKQELSEKEQPEDAVIPPEVKVLRKEPRVAKKRSRIQRIIPRTLPLIEEGLTEKT